MSNTQRARKAPASTKGPAAPVELVTSKVPDEVEMVDLFSIDGVMYKMRKRVPANEGLQYLRMAREKGQDLAMTWAVEQAIGEDGYEALMNFKGLTDDQLGRIMTIVHDTLIGSVDGPKG